MDSQLGQALGRLHYGLYFLSAGSARQPEGMLVSWVGQVSGEPPLLLAAVRENRGMIPLLTEQKAFALNLLPAGDRELLADLARPAGERFNGLSLADGPGGLPWLPAGAGALFCRDCQISRPGDHVLFTGQVFAARQGQAGPVLSVADLGHVYLGLS